VVRIPVFAATPLCAGGIDPGARAAIVSGVHHLSAAAAGGDGFGQGEIKNDECQNPNDERIPNDSIPKPASADTTSFGIWISSFFPESFRG
jgi:hypothetical protein